MMHATARFSVRYGAELVFAGADLPRPRRLKAPTRYGSVPVHVYGELGRPAYVHLHGGAWLMRYPADGRLLVPLPRGDRRCDRGERRLPRRALRHLPRRPARVARRRGCGWLRRAHPSRSAASAPAAGSPPSVCLQARDRSTFAPVLQVLGVPALDLASEVPRTERNDLAVFP